MTVQENVQGSSAQQALALRTHNRLRSWGMVCLRICSILEAEHPGWGCRRAALGLK